MNKETLRLGFVTPMAGPGGGIKMVAANDYLYNFRVASNDFADKSTEVRCSIASMAVNSKGELYALDRYNHCIYKYSISWQ